MPNPGSTSAACVVNGIRVADRRTEKGVDPTPLQPAGWTPLRAGRGELVSVVGPGTGPERVVAAMARRATRSATHHHPG